MVQKNNNKNKINFKQINQDERIEIYRYKEQWLSCRKIWIILNRDHTSISRELLRNSIDLWWWRSKYKPSEAEKKKNERRKKAIQTHIKLKKNHNLRNKIFSLLSDETKCRWPDEILWYLKLKWRKVIVTSTLYRYIHKYTNDWRRYLRYKKEWYKRKLWKRKKTTTIPNVPKIDERPKEANNRERIWDFEFDTIVSKWHIWWLFTANDRLSRYVIIRKIKNHKSKDMVYTIFRAMEKENIKTWTSDNWVEFALLSIIWKKLWIQVFTAHPYASYERWTNERSNWLIRRFIPKWSDISKYTDKQIEEIQNKLNNKPRKILWYKTPYEVYNSAK